MSIYGSSVGNSKSPQRVLRGCLQRFFPQKRRPYFLELKPTRRKMIAIRLVNSSSTSVSNPNIKKIHGGKTLSRSSRSGPFRKTLSMDLTCVPKGLSARTFPRKAFPGKSRNHGLIDVLMA